MFENLRIIHHLLLTHLHFLHYSRFRRSSIVNSEDKFDGGSGPYFDLQFDAGPALAILREMGLVRGSDEEGLEIVTTSVKPRGVKTKKLLSALLSPECQEDDLGFPKILIRQ